MKQPFHLVLSKIYNNSSELGKIKIQYEAATILKIYIEENPDEIIKPLKHIHD